MRKWKNNTTREKIEKCAYSDNLLRAQPVQESASSLPAASSAQHRPAAAKQTITNKTYVLFAAVIVKIYTYSREQRETHQLMFESCNGRMRGGKLKINRKMLKAVGMNPSFIIAQPDFSEKYEPNQPLPTDAQLIWNNINSQPYFCPLSNKFNHAVHNDKNTPRILIWNKK